MLDMTYILIKPFYAINASFPLLAEYVLVKETPVTEISRIFRRLPGKSLIFLLKIPQ